ncbi:uncharacterized protein LOC120186911 [Hibiscus syriacus]|uniref:uncharacterized protein LOC120186911 n=1 Tax=Hibiscus syriacus TaxID=106335 RepID=UPI001924C191|nr:uncharacterized protein LOC120186911 [Hibiscus syriacus]
MIAQNQSESSGQLNGGVVSVSDCRLIINAALDRNNADLALSVFYAMRSSFDTSVSETEALVVRWKWSRPDVGIYTTLVQGLAALVRVSDALRIIDDVCRVGVSPSEEIVCCAKCRYKYELVSGNIVSVDSEEIKNSSCRTQHGDSSMEKGAKISADISSKEFLLLFTLFWYKPLLVWPVRTDLLLKQLIFLHKDLHKEKG